MFASCPLKEVFPQFLVLIAISAFRPSQQALSLSLSSDEHGNEFLLWSPLLCLLDLPFPFTANRPSLYFNPFLFLC